MNGLSTRQQIRRHRAIHSDSHRKIDTVIGWVGCFGMAVFVLIELAGRLS